jgi:MFS family permease
MFKHITKTVWIISLISLFNDISSEMLYPVIPLYLAQIGYGAPLIGFLEGFAELLSGFSKIYTGSLSDSLKRRLPFVQLGYGLSIASRPIMGLFQNAYPILFARILDRVGKGIRTGARDAILADESSNNTQATVFGFHRSMDTLGAVIGPCLALLFLFFFPENYKGVILLTLVPGVIAFAFTMHLKEKKNNSTSVDFSLKNHFSYFKNATKNYKSLVLILFIFAFASSSDMYLLLQAKSSGLNEIQILTAYIFFNLIFALTAYPLGRWADKVGKVKMLLTGIIIYMVSYYCIGFSSSFYIIGFGFVLYGLYYACTDGIIKSLLIQFSKKKEKASAIGFYAGVNGIILFFANITTGWIWFQFGSSVVFIGIISIAAICFLLLLLSKNINNKA